MKGRDHLPSSRITLSPKTVISNLPVASKRERMFLIGFERAFLSIAATPIYPPMSNDQWTIEVGTGGLTPPGEVLVLVLVLVLT